MFLVILFIRIFCLCTFSFHIQTFVFRMIISILTLFKERNNFLFSLCCIYLSIFNDLRLLVMFLRASSNAAIIIIWVVVICMQSGY